ncbi:hypothetical protein [Aquimarina sp. 2201CG5-10]|uniref:hypothetical protein n=1 Tax=Aquimarina callyspongiae TaxID=3098150 RepID=UPI002AB43A54|nr:hypothetical protein [Aquimarina sp. 2201CG5-10]MDY8135321.1 hypothetical protein [Aquimarina sp. 2201CG5-10]
MRKQYKVIKISENWSIEKLRTRIEETLNKFSNDGWMLEDLSFIPNTYVAIITISK